MSVKLVSNNNLLKYIEQQYVFFDKNSLEKSTGRIKEKYKLATNNKDLASMGVYIFFVLTTNECACKYYITANKKDWENRDKKHLYKISFIDINHTERLKSIEIINKINDPNNKFRSVARLKDVKYRELQKLKRMCHRSIYDIEYSTQVAVSLCDDISLAHISDELLKKIGLN